MAIVVPHSLTNYQSPGRPSAAGIRTLAARIAGTVRLWRSRARERHAYVQFDDFALRDLGLSRWEMERELAKPFWRG